MNNLFLAAAVTAVLFGAWRWLGAAAAPPIDEALLARAVADGATLVDVRTPGEFASGHVEGARNIPLQELPSRLHALGSKQRPVLVYCRSGNRSGSAKRQLERAGFQRVINLGSKGRAEQALQRAASAELAAEGVR
ncbi:MAG: rhodanese-like domain-containing protein [Deltaproteobacteria bacterium]|nr:rhodanese-like domain-containing protein [Deltaproteobacteria bacterium]MBW2534462.1 rhodanese-like domain-containing protein [Deltaproteobacteria bacterium]